MELSFKNEPLTLSCQNAEEVKKFIETEERERLDGYNQKKELVAVTITKGVEMCVSTYQKNGWIRTNVYDKNGNHFEELYDGKWNKLEPNS